jgi:hypothetical protein
VPTANDRRRGGAALLVLALALALVAGACGGGGGSASNSTTTTADLPDTGPAYGTTAVSTPVGTRSLLTSVAVSSQKHFTRIVFEFRDTLPGYKVDYATRPITQDGSGKEVQVAGDEALLVRFEPSSGFDTEAAGGGKPTYTGSKRIAAGSPAVTEVVQVGDFEAVLQWAVGLNGRRPFRIVALPSQARLVLDVKNEP